MERPILFSTSMANAILAGKKTVTRRIIRQTRTEQCPFGVPGARLWLKEDFYAFGHWKRLITPKKDHHRLHFVDMTTESGQSYQFLAPEINGNEPQESDTSQWWHRTARAMPRWASRIELEVIAISAEKLHDINEEQAQAEGFYPLHDSVQTYFANYLPPPYTGMSPTAVIAFATHWQNQNKNRSWSDNPWVWVISFRRI